jgi:hypothetical protein
MDDLTKCRFFEGKPLTGVSHLFFESSDTAHALKKQKCDSRLRVRKSVNQPIRSLAVDRKGQQIQGILYADGIAVGKCFAKAPVFSLFVRGYGCCAVKVNGGSQTGSALATTVGVPDTGTDKIRV